MSGRVPSRGSDQFNLRLPDGMRDQIAATARRNGRSMNAEIVRLIERSLDNDATVAEAVSGAPPDTWRDMEDAALKFFKAMELARNHGGRVTLEVHVDGINDEDTSDNVSRAAFNALAGESTARREDPEGTN